MSVPPNHLLRFQAAATRAAWNRARAAACPWWAPVRRAILLRLARQQEREARMHFELAVADAKRGARA